MKNVLQNVRNLRITPTLLPISGRGSVDYRTAPYFVNPLTRYRGIDHASAELTGAIRHRRIWLLHVIRRQLCEEDRLGEPTRNIDHFREIWDSDFQDLYETDSR